MVNVRVIVGLVFILILILVVGGTAWYFLVHKPAQKVFVQETQKTISLIEKEFPEDLERFNPRIAEYRTKFVGQARKATSLKELNLILLQAQERGALERKRAEKIEELEKVFTGPSDFMLKFGNARKELLRARINDATTIEQIIAVDVVAMLAEAWRDYRVAQITQIPQRTVVMIRREKDEPPEMIVVSKEQALEMIEQASIAKSIDLLKELEMEPEIVAVPLLLERRQAASGLLDTGYVVDIFMEVEEREREQVIEEEIEGKKVRRTVKMPIKPVVRGALVLGVIRGEDKSGRIELSETEEIRKEGEGSESKSSTIEDETIEESRKSEGRIEQTLEKRYRITLQDLLKAASAGKVNRSFVSGMLSKYAWELAQLEAQANLGELEIDYLVLVAVPVEVAGEINQNQDKVTLMPQPFNPNNTWYQDVLEKIWG
ncbi:MAG: hypothetical protein DRO11_03365 [Methanobacteriota archaeon]|nr:MAG: hypothetical protein DRO11_03365 [Euryarchaeota archaeon]